MVNFSECICTQCIFVFLLDIFWMRRWIFVSSCAESLSSSVVSLPQWGSVCCSLPGQAKAPSFIYSESCSLQTQTVIDALDNQLNPTLRPIGRGILQYFGTSSTLCDGNLCYTVKDRRWHLDSASEISQQPRGCIYQMYFHLLVWGEPKHASGDYLQTISFYKVPCSAALLKSAHGKKSLTQ